MNGEGCAGRGCLQYNIYASKVVCSLCAPFPHSTMYMNHQWYKAEVIASSKNLGMYHVQYKDDGTVDLNLPRSALREYHKPGQGEMIQAKYVNPEDGQDIWMDSVIVVDHGNGTYDVRHFNSQLQRNVRMEDLRRIRWPFSEGYPILANVLDDNDGDEERWLPGKIVRDGSNRRYDIKLDNGDIGECISWRSIRYTWAYTG